MGDAYSLVRQAIINRQQIIANYQGYRREMCPHVLGRKNGRSMELFYQFGGGSSNGLGRDGSGENWRCIPVSGLSDIVIRDGKWHTAPTHSRRQTCIEIIDVEVSA